MVAWTGHLLKGWVAGGKKSDLGQVTFPLHFSFENARSGAFQTQIGKNAGNRKKHSWAPPSWPPKWARPHIGIGVKKHLWAGSAAGGKKSDLGQVHFPLHFSFENARSGAFRTKIDKNTEIVTKTLWGTTFMADTGRVGHGTAVGGWDRCGLNAYGGMDWPPPIGMGG